MLECRHPWRGLADDLPHRCGLQVLHPSDTHVCRCGARHDEDPHWQSRSQSESETHRWKVSPIA